MRNRRRLLAFIFSLSVAANVALWLKVNHPLLRAETASITDSPSVSIVTNRDLAPAQQSAAKVTWPDLDDPTISKFIANLRAVKCPELTIRDLVTARLDEQLDERIASIPGVTEFWSTAIQKERLQAQQREKARGLEREEEAQIHELLGVDWNRDAYLNWVLDPYNEFSLGFLPREKAMSVEFDIQSLGRTVETAFKGRDIAPRSDAQELERLSRHLKSTLTPDEYAELNLRFLATMVHSWGLPDAQLSGGDMRYIVTLYARHLDFMDYYLISPSKFEELKKSARAAAQEDISNYLGPVRYAAFQRAEDYQYVCLHKIVHDAGLNPDVANTIFTMKPEASRQALAISQNVSLTADARTQQLTDLRNQYRASVVKLLGDEPTKQCESRADPWWNKLGEVANSGGAK